MPEPIHLADRVLIALPWSRLPLSQNDRHTHYRRNETMQDTIWAARLAIRNARPRLAIVGAEVVLHAWFPDRRQRDTDNMAPTLKACLDALVQEGVLPDDSWVHVPFSGQRIHLPTKQPPYGCPFVLELSPCD